MRRTFVFLSLLAMLGVVGVMGALRERPDLARALAEAEKDEAAEPDEAAGAAEKDDAGEAGSKGDAKAGSKDEAGAEGAATGAQAVAGEGNEAAGEAAEPESLRVVALGWEVLAPGVLANGGMAPGEDSHFREAGLRVDFAAVSDAEQVEVRLGRGGKDERGADVALMPLPAFVASYERLRALSPQVFFVVGWSRGRDAIVGQADLLVHPPRGGKVRVRGEAGSSQTLLTLFALDQAGVSPSRVELYEDEGHRHALEAVRRRKSRQLDARALVMSTADATHLVPVVAVAPAGVLERRQSALARWSRIWMDGARTLSADPPEAARQLAAQKSAPEAVDLIDALGWMEFTDLHGAAQAAGLSGRGAVNLDVLFHRTWDLWREVGLLTTPSPERVPLSGTVIAELARETTAPAKSSRAAGRGSGDVLLVHTVPGRRLDADGEASLVSEVGFLAGVFSRSTLEVWIPRSPEAAERVAHHAAERFGLAKGRVVVRPEKDRKAGKAAVITVHAAR